jgi:alcohol dehydrogenase
LETENGMTIVESPIAFLPERIVETLPAFDHEPLGRVVYGPGSIAKLGELTRELGGHRVLLVTDPGLERAGHPQRAERVLRDSGLEVTIFDGVEENPETQHVVAGAGIARRRQIDFLVAVGGGSSMDCAKGINFVYTNGGQISDYRGQGKATKPMLPSIGIPTTAGTGSEAQSYALIADASSHMKMACGDRKAAFRISILDPELTVSQPSMVTAVTGLDALTHAIESYVCTKRTPLSQAFSLAAWRHLQTNYSRVLDDPSDLIARGEMQLGAYFAGVAIEASMLGAAHACANPLTAHYGTTHGVAVGIMLPHVIRYNGQVVRHWFADLVAGDEFDPGELPDQALACWFTDLMSSTGLPTRLADCGVSRSILPLLAEEANQQWTARFNPRPTAEADLLDLYQAAW